VQLPLFPLRIEERIESIGGALLGQNYLEFAGQGLTARRIENEDIQAIITA
jgi:hypothetical protein